MLQIDAMPRPLRAINDAAAVAPTADDALSIEAGPRTDWFIDPDTGATTRNAPALVMPAPGTWMLSTLASADHRTTFDAAVLVVYVSDDVWAKLCLERSPQGQVTIVSVVTRGTSDDCNSVPINDSQAHLRVSRLDRAYAFHHSTDGTRWDLVRYFTLGEDQEPEVGFLAQSPSGESCRATFRAIDFSPRLLVDLRSGA